VPPTSNAELAETVVAIVEKLISLPFLNRVNALEAEDGVPKEPLYMDDAAEAGIDPFRSLRHEVTVVALLRPLYALDADARSQCSCKSLRKGGELVSQPLRCCCGRPCQAVPLDDEPSDPAELGAPRLEGSGGGTNAILDDDADTVVATLDIDGVRLEHCAEDDEEYRDEDDDVCDLEPLAMDGAAKDDKLNRGLSKVGCALRNNFNANITVPPTTEKVPSRTLLGRCCSGGNATRQ
jgi:hypothetical protein